jgi:predicted O-methyltransferase YrrM
MMDSIWSPRDGSDEWLSRRDGALAVLLFRHIQAIRTESNCAVEPILEVGVWKGAWVSTLLMNTSVDKVLGVDPYPSLASIRSQMLSNLDTLDIADRFDLYDSLESLPEGQQYSLIHIDGEHSEQAVERELQYAAGHLARNGVIIVDDFRNFWFPGVSSAVYRSLERLKLRIVATTQGKAYLSHQREADALYKTVVQVCAQLNLPVSTKFDPTGLVVSYEKPTTVLDQPLLLIGGTRPQSNPFRATIRRFLPPILLDLIRHLRRRRR